ncbi:AMP-binding protein [Aestuariivita sp.]|jgi:acyl-CoA synthetase (AMP-forming)/AMP-acid ligase II|uniref:class I adenylate-forming enzyme family protein n=1 Tax=Aestuariivita sp. TaxID=1872407 RepID=UPI0021713147|nr:AMP-binding protein [Aestuariivita sp.]MCE8005655.1 AMP-binding protein [Aestuariivita sp.]
MTDRLDDPQVYLPDLFATHARHYPDKDAILCGDQRRSWGAFVGNINRVAHALIDAGVDKGDRVAVMMGNSPEMLECLFGAVRAGACVVPLSGLLTGEQLEHLLADCDAVAAIVSDDFAERAIPLRDRVDGIATWIAHGFAAEGWRDLKGIYQTMPDTVPDIRHALTDPFNIIYSSGTTGLPKGILQTHRARLHWAFSNAVEMGFTSDSRALTTTPLYSNGTWLMMLPILFAGGTLHVMPAFDAARFLELVERERITHTFMVPAQYLMVLERPELEGADLSSLRTVLSAGSPLRRNTKRQIIERISPGLYELYGFSEGFASLLKPHQHAAKFDTVGTPVLGFEVRILDEDGTELARGEAGEIAGYGAGIMQQYNKRDTQTAALIWRDERGRSFIRSGDIGLLDEDGFLKIIDRKKDMIISGGFNVFPTDVEAIVGQHPDVMDVTVIGVPHEKWGESCLALVIPAAGAVPDPEAIQSWANARLAKTQRLVGVELREAFPRNALGKVIKKELRAPYWESAAT